jgi:hypothetical protein
MIQKENVKSLRRNKRYAVKTHGYRVRKSRVRGCRKLGCLTYELFGKKKEKVPAALGQNLIKIRVFYAST